ncbi:MAG: N-6 DNA methylase [Planctomycetes bacterium]|nr:N-6 DNA methylase [Planctomycetota bacterium]
MTTATQKDWKKEFGVAESKPPRFFSGRDDLDVTTPQGHLLRRAFDILKLDGILCADHSPLVYFKQLTTITADEVFRLHKLFWNHGGAPVLVLISDDKVHVYSGMSRPLPGNESPERMPSLVATLDRVATGLRAFLTSVESGEFFRQHRRSFNPAHRVDRALLENLSGTREELASATRRKIPTDILDALLCRLVFTCYLFDREVIGQSYLTGLGAKGASHLKDVLAIQPAATAKTALYRLFKRLGKDFNGDLFSADLGAEAEFVDEPHIETLKNFFHGTAVRGGQRSFWPYDFSIIPIETISAIYERFLKESDEQAGAFYTPRFLAEVVLDTALDGMGSVLGKKFLDPACGSGIFLVGLFNRMAEEWKQQNPTARNPRRARELMKLLRESLHGVDLNPTACRITAFSLYLAYLDQLSPRDIQELQEHEGEPPLPNLVATEKASGNIRRADFFDGTIAFPTEMDLVIGNPPWGSTATGATPAGQWCAAHGKPVPDKQIAAAFVWKAIEHIASDGRICFLLPDGILFNSSSTALAFQRAFVRQHSIDRVLNLADFRWFLFERAVHAALVLAYRKPPASEAQHQIEYWVPKTDWTVIGAEVITIGPADRSTVAVGEVLQDLTSPDAPQIWKQRFWASPRELRLLDRLSLYPRLRDHVRGPKERKSSKPWIMAVGFQPVRKGDDPEKAQTIALPSKEFIPATSPGLDLVLLTSDCQTFDTPSVEVRSGSNKNTEVFRAPHVLVAKGFTRIAYCDFDVSFQDALRGIHGPPAHRSLLVFLAAYLRSPLATFYLFHTASDWGITRPQIHVDEVLRVPMPLPDQQPNPQRCWQIVEKVAEIVTDAARKASADFADRQGIVRSADAAITPLIDEYFNVHVMEKPLIEDTLKVTIPSIQPTRKRMPVPTVAPSSVPQREAYCARVCAMLNDWAKRGNFKVRGTVHGSEAMGIGMAVLEKVSRTDAKPTASNDGHDMLEALDHLRKAFPQRLATLDVVRGILVFDKNRLYVVKPISQRHWTQTAAMNDADETAGTILMRPLEGDA